MKLLLTIDVEAHRIIDEISGKFDGLGVIMESLKAHDLRATFFLDISETKTWSRDFMSTVCRRIKEAGHDLQLHIHPHHASGDNRWLLSGYSEVEQEALIGGAVKDFEQLAGHRPVAFRAGGFGINDATLKILEKNGLRLDSSYVWNRPGCDIRPERIASPSQMGEIIEVPLNPVITLGARFLPIRISSLDFNWLPLGTLKRSLRALKEKGAPTAVVLLHSSSLMARTGPRSFMPRTALREKWNALLKNIREENYEVVTASDLLKAPPLDGKDVVLTVKNPIEQYGILLNQAMVGCGFNAKFRFFLILNVLALAAGLFWLVNWAARP